MQAIGSFKMLGLAAALAVLLHVGTASASITNGDFETAGAWSYSESTSSWSGAYDNGVYHGGASSYRLTWPTLGTGGVGAHAEITQTIAVPSASRFYELDLWVKDDYPKGCRRYNFPYKQILVDNQVVWEDSVQGYEGASTNGWLHVLQDVSAAMMGKTQAVVALRVTHKAVVDKTLDLSMMLRTSLTAGSVDLGATWTNDTIWGVMSATSPGAWGRRDGRVPIPEGAPQFRLWARPYNFTGNVWVDDIYYSYGLDNPNPYMECGSDSLPDNWLNSGYSGTNVTVSFDTTRYYAGAKSVKISAPLGASNGGGVWSDWIPVSPGQVLEISTMVYTAFTGGYFFFGVIFDNGAYPWVSTWTRSQNAWSLRSGKVTAPAGVKKFRVWAHAGGDYGFSGSFWVDDVFVRRSLNSDFESGTNSLPNNWSRDGSGSISAATVTNMFYSGAKSVNMSGTNTTGGIWSDWIALPTNYPADPLLGVNVWWDDVALNTDKDTALEVRRINVGYGLGDYAAETRLPNGHLDVTTMISGLTNANIRDYNYLIFNGQYDWEDLPGFLDAAYTNGIRVWVALASPGEDTGSKPFRYNFLPDDEDSDIAGEINDRDGDNTDNWSYQIGQLSLTHPNLVGWYIDDFIGGAMDDTSLVMNMTTKLHSINPCVAFMPCIYYTDIAKCPASWRTWDNDLTAQEGWQTNVYHAGTGTHSICIGKAVAGGYPRWMGSPISFSPPYPTNFTVGGWGKALNVGTYALFCVALEVTFDDNSIQSYWSANTRFSNGTHDWENKQDAVTFGKGIKSILPYCLLYSATGTAWFDDMYLMVNGTNQVRNGNFESGLPTLADSILPHMDGIVFPYTDLDSYADLADEIDDIRQRLGSCKSLITMIYMGGTSWHPASVTLAYVEGALTTAHDQPGNDGVQAYCLGLTNPTNTKYQLVQSLYSAWIYPSGWSTYDNDLDNETGWATDDYRSGVHSLKIVKTATGGNPLWVGSAITFTTPYPTNFTFGGWGKAENVGTNALFGLNFYVTYSDDTAEWYGSANTYFSNGTHDWQNKEDVVAFAKGVKSIIPYCLLYNDTGTAWFDDLYMICGGTNVLVNPGAEISQ